MSIVKETIKAEVERLKKILEESTYYLDNSQQALGYSFALDDLEEFIDSLPEEKPSEDLEEAAEKYIQGTLCDLDDGPTVGLAKGGFIAGAEWHEQQMMKEAVEGTLGYGPHLQRPIIMLEQVPDIWNGSCQSVKIIIVKQ